MKKSFTRESKSSGQGDTSTILVIACGKAKIWRRSRSPEKVPAKIAYTSSLFRLSRKYAEQFFAGRWVILSAKHGLLLPNREIRNYDVTFTEARKSVSDRKLMRQWMSIFPNVRVVVSLAGQSYNERLRRCLPSDVELTVPLSRLNLFERIQWLKRTLDRGK